MSTSPPSAADARRTAHSIDCAGERAKNIEQGGIMDLIRDGFREAFWMLIHNRSDVYQVAWRSVYVSGSATLVSLVLGVGAGAMIAFKRFPGRLIVMTLVNTGMGLPPVVIGLFVAIVLWRSG